MVKKNSMKSVASKPQFDATRKYRKGDVFYTGTTKWVYVGQLAYDVRDVNRKVVLPAGTKGVAIAYRSANWHYRDSRGKLRAGNLYRCRGKVY